MWSDESSFMFLPTSGWVCVLRTPKEAYNAECLVPAIKYRGKSVIFFYRSHPIVFCNNTVIYSVNNTAYIGNQY